MVTILIVLLIVCVALYLLNKYVPGTPPPLATVKIIISAIVVVLSLLWLLSVFGYVDTPTWERRPYVERVR